MQIPYVIDNQIHKMVDVLNRLLTGHAGKSVDVATAYFNIRGFRLVQKGLESLGSFRLLIGAEPDRGESVGLIEKAPQILRGLWGDMQQESYSEETLRTVEDLIAFLRREKVQIRVFEQGFLHAKCYIFYGDTLASGIDRFKPVAAIVGSSNFTGPGLTTNKELNLTHKAILSDEEVDDPIQQNLWEPQLAETDDQITLAQKRLWKSSVGARAIADLDQWFERQWIASRDFKAELIDLLDASKFGQKEYTPYQIYMKAVFEYFKDDLDTEAPQAVRSAVELTEFQEDAVKKARKILARYDGVVIADSVGLGKTWIGKKLLEDTAYHQRQKALVISPASLRKMWTDELSEAAISSITLSQEELGQADFNIASYSDVDLILIDESHNFRSRSAQRYENLERLVAGNGGRGRAGVKKKMILLTATPINNDLFDLYHQITLFTGGDRSYFAGAGIGDLYRYFLNARREGGSPGGSVALFNLLEEVVIRRTRPFIRKAYPKAMIKGKEVRWPERKLRTIRYDLEATYAGIYEKIVSGIEKLRLAPYNLEAYKKKGIQQDLFEIGREEALVGIFKSRYLKRFESSIEAFRISVRRALEFIKTFESYVLEGKVLDSTSFHKAMRYLSREDAEDDATPASRADELDITEEAKEVLEALPRLDPILYDLRRLHEALQKDVEVLTEIWHDIKEISPEKDAKLERLKAHLATDMKGKKLLIFTYYRDTARYLYRELGGVKGSSFLDSIGNPKIRRMDSSETTKERGPLVAAFAPKANNRSDLIGSEQEIDILISTDVLSEGQNLQDCGYLVNYDLHWNPTRMIQRAGRIDRLGTDHETLWIYNMFPDAGLERLLGLVESLNRKINDIDRLGFLDASILGETAHPQNFNTLKRIREEDGSVIEEQEQFTELAGSEFLLQQLRALLASGARKMLEELPDGIHSGLHRSGYRGVFFYFTAPDSHGEGRQHFWRFYDSKDGKILDNRFIIANLIACAPDTPRFIGEIDVFQIQEKVIEDILRSSLEQQAIEEAPKILDPVQSTIVTLLRSYLNHPEIDRKELRHLIQTLEKPMRNIHLKILKKAYGQFSLDHEFGTFISAIKTSVTESITEPTSGGGGRREILREDLHLVCFDFVWS